MSEPTYSYYGQPAFETADEMAAFMGAQGDADRHADMLDALADVEDWMLEALRATRENDLERLHVYNANLEHAEARAVSLGADAEALASARHLGVQRWRESEARVKAAKARELAMRTAPMAQRPAFSIFKAE